MLESKNWEHLIYFEVEDNVVIKHTPIPQIGENVYKTEVVLTKEIFQECYKKWVEPQESKEKHKADMRGNNNE